MDIRRITLAALFQLYLSTRTSFSVVVRECRSVLRTGAEKVTLGVRAVGTLLPS
jgi:hypothetical protein